MKRRSSCIFLVASMLAASAASADAPADPPELAQARAAVDAARQQLHEAEDRLGQTEAKLGIDSPRALAWSFMNDPKRGALGIVFGRGGNEPKLRVLGVTPGGAAEAAGLRERDVLLAIDDLSFTGLDAETALAKLHPFTRTLTVGTKLKVRYERDGKAAETTLTADRPKLFGRPLFAKGGPPPREFMGGGPGSFSEPFPRFDGPTPDDAPLRMTTLTPELAPYFKLEGKLDGKAEGGVLVLSVRSLDGDLPPLGLKAGDVIQKLDGKPVDSPIAVFEGFLRAAGGTVHLVGVRGGAALALDVAVPTRDAMEAQRRRHHRPGFSIE